MKRTRLRPVSARMRATLPAKRAMRDAVLARAKGRCEGCGIGALLEVHHRVKRSAGGQDEAQNGVALCRPCHQRTDWPYEKGRLVIDVDRRVRLVWAKDKWAAR